MTGLNVILDGDGCWPDLADGKTPIHHVKDGIEIAALPAGMSGGSPSLMIRINLPDGSVVMAETSLKLFLTAGDAFKARHGDPRT